MKRVFIIIITLVVSLFFTLKIAPPLHALSTANIRYIQTCIGENETSIGINYHADIIDTWVTYSTSPTFNVAKSVKPTNTLFEQEKMDNDANTGFNARFVARVNLTDLKENTTYYFKVEAKNESSVVHSFTTGSSSATDISFLFASDIHASAGWNISGTTNSNIQNILNKNQNINVAVMTGDQVDRGGWECEWATYYDKLKVFDNLVVAAIPGNHEYYHSKDAAYVSPYFFNQFYNNPKNGIEQRLNSSYYFTYGNALVIMIDTINREYLNEQKEWFKDVVANNQRQWIIVGTHAGAITAGSYKDDARWIKTNWVPVFEECQIDLALSGHEHVYIRKDNDYKNNVDEDLGITYLVTSSVGAKQYGGVQTEGQTVKNINNAANVIRITENRMTVSLYNGNGQKEGMEFVLTPKRYNTVTSLTDDEMKESIDFIYDKENELVDFNWSSDLYGNITKVIVTKDQEGSLKDYEVLMTTVRMNHLQIKPIFNEYNYKFTVKLYKTDGTILSKDFNITNRTPEVLDLRLNGGSLANNALYLKYYPGSKFTLPIPTLEGAVFGGWYETKDFSGQSITVIPETATGPKTYYAKWLKQKTITYHTNGGTLPDNAVTSYQEGTFCELAEPTKTKYTFAGWYLDQNLTQPIDIIDDTIMGNLNLYAKWNKVSGCKKNSATFILSLISSCTMLYILKKKDN